MKKLLLFLSLVSMACYGQDSMEGCESYVSDKIVNIQYGLPVVRQVYGGTKICIDYEGAWNNEMKGALEYASKIWEEALPTSLPIRILAILDNESDSRVFSEVSYKKKSVDNITQYGMWSSAAPWSQIKAITLQELSGQSNVSLYSPYFEKSMLDSYDAVIIYYNKRDKLIENCSFALNEDLELGYYDFVSLALRDIGKSLGIIRPSLSIKDKKLLFRYNDDTPYEKFVKLGVGSDKDGQVAYQKATSGTIQIGDWDMPQWSLYAPSPWDDARSLNYFIPDARKLTQLLSYEFGRNSVVRDISDDSTYDFFRNVMCWQGQIAVGGSGSSYGESKSSNTNVIPYKGLIPKVKNFSLRDSAIYTGKNIAVEAQEIFNDMSLTDSLENYLPPTYQGPTGQGREFAILKNDGTWDVVYWQDPLEYEENVSASDFVLHYPITEYARTCDGYMRCRISIGVEDRSIHKIVYHSTYWVLDYLPQQIDMALSRIMPVRNESDYTRDVKIGIKNLEGVTKVIVAQKDEDNNLPYYYEISDFKKGYFMATVEKDAYTTFTVTSYNNNGYTSSDTYTVYPLDDTQRAIDITFIPGENTLSNM